MKATQPVVRAEVLVVPRLNGHGTESGAVGDGAADGLHSKDKGRRSGRCCGCRGQCAGRPAQREQRTAQQMVLREQRTLRRAACTARTKDGVADGAAGAEDSAADGLHSENKGRRSRWCCGNRGHCGGWPAQ